MRLMAGFVASGTYKQQWDQTQLVESGGHCFTTEATSAIISAIDHE